MNSYSLKDQFISMFQSIVAFLPSLLAGIVLLLVGWLLAWLAKRLVVRIAVVLRLGRLLTGFRWGKDFEKADLRQGLYNFIGSIVAAVVFLIFLMNAFEAWHLQLMSRMLEKGISIFPRVFTASVAFGLGWLISLWAARSVQRAMLHEQIPGATLIARIVKAVLIVFFSAMALVELDLARQIVAIGFGAFVVTLGALLVVVAASGGRDFFRQKFDSISKSAESKE